MVNVHLVTYIYVRSSLPNNDPKVTIKYKAHQIPKRFSSRLAVVFGQSIEVNAKSKMKS